MNTSGQNSVTLLSPTLNHAPLVCAQRHHPYGLLKQLLIPERPWNSISMNFIKKLPLSDNSAMILVIIDCLTKQLIFIPTVNTITSLMLAKLFILICNSFTLSLSFSQITKELWPDIISMVFLNDRCECYSKRCSCLTKNYSHTQACDNYYTNCTYLPATGFTGLSMTMSSLVETNWASASVNLSSSVVCSNILLDDVAVCVTTLAGHGGGCIDCLAAMRFVASFHIVLFVVFLTHCLVNSSITSETHSEVRPAWMLSHWRTLTSSFVPSFHLGHVVGVCNCIQPSLLFGILYWPLVSMS